MSFTTQLMQEFQRFCGVMFGAPRNPMLRCGVATRRKTVDSSRPGTAMLDSEPFVKLLRTLVVSVAESFVLWLSTFLPPLLCDVSVRVSIWFAAHEQSLDVNSYRHFIWALFIM